MTDHQWNYSRFPALFVHANTNYDGARFDLYDVNRNALNCPDGSPVVAHPPCRLWGTLRGLSTAPSYERRLAQWAVLKVLRNGGVLEHPAASKIWEWTARLPVDGYHIIGVNMNWFGFPAKKPTRLLVSGIDLKEIPAIPLSFDAITHCIGPHKKTLMDGKKELNKRRRAETPIRMVDWVFETLVTINKKKYEQARSTNENEAAVRI